MPIETIDANDARIETDMIYADKSYAGKDVYLKAFEYVDQEKNQFKNTIPGSQTTKILIIRLGFFCHTLTFHHLLYKSKKMYPQPACRCQRDSCPTYRLFVKPSLRYFIIMGCLFICSCMKDTIHLFQSDHAYDLILRLSSVKDCCACNSCRQKHHLCIKHRLCSIACLCG